ncbi:hypothetical protein [Moritella sp. F3]|uniref:hypothetical protein n=1 Tax=Moritella sp. F3 TaxID=2718882 RepID=UPI0018E1980D|nr:hypothetical protein [Moritella sp. F3]GIC77665.1 hypothetical protein FMO001_23920 [Moritella sp. F1]GIC82078.1 hypothetical protein FMO003_23590 [Moritella sp. F3]
MTHTETESVKQVFERLSKSALLGVDDGDNCTVKRDDLSTLLLAYQLELNNTKGKSETDFNICEKMKVEQRIVGMEMVVERFENGHGLNENFEVSPELIYDLCDEIYGGDSQEVRGKFQPSESN